MAGALILTVSAAVSLLGIECNRLPAPNSERAGYQWGHTFVLRFQAVRIRHRVPDHLAPLEGGGEEADPLPRRPEHPRRPDQDHDFKPFGKALTKIKNRTADKAFEIYLSLYQAVTGTEEDQNIYKQFSPDFARRETTGGAAPRVNVATVKAYPIPIPPPEEQESIVAKVDHLMALVDELETQLAASRSTAGHSSTQSSES